MKKGNLIGKRVKFKFTVDIGFGGSRTISKIGTVTKMVDHPFYGKGTLIIKPDGETPLYARKCEVELITKKQEDAE